MRVRLMIVMSLVVSACGAAADLSSSAAPSTLGLVDTVPTTEEAAELTETTVVVEMVDPTTAQSATVSPTVAQSTTTSLTTASPTTALSTSEPIGETTTSTTASTQADTTSTTATMPPRPAGSTAAFCQAAGDLRELGTLTSFDDAEAAAAFFEAQVNRWDAAAVAAPSVIAADVQTVATFQGDVQRLLESNGFDLFASVEELTELEVSSGSDDALIRTDQFTFANCAVTPPLAEQAMAAFYGRLLDSAADRNFLAELLASAEVFSLEGAACFVDNATPDVMHPLVGAPATAAQDTALASVLSTCQLSIGTP